MYVPNKESIRSEIIMQTYNSKIASYFIVARTHKLISRSYFWYSLERDVRKYVSTYVVC